VGPSYLCPSKLDEAGETCKGKTLAYSRRISVTKKMTPHSNTSSIIQQVCLLNNDPRMRTKQSGNTLDRYKYGHIADINS
jgi:hypothetical protein